MLIAWLILGAVLLLFEMHNLAFYAIFGAIGSFAAALVAVVAPSAVPLQVGVAAGVGVAGVVAARPFVSKAFDSRRTGISIRGVHGGLVGHEAVTLDEVGATHLDGHVRLTGERWLAVSGSGRLIRPGTVVVVTAVQGTTLVVWPVDSLDDAPLELPTLPGHATEAAPSDNDDAPNGADGRTT